MKKLTSLIMAALLMLSPLGALALTKGALHTDEVHQGSVYATQDYLYDALTLAGSGFAQEMHYTLYALETLAKDESLNLGYEHDYSLMTSGSSFSTVRFSGIRLYDFLVYAGLDTALPGDTPVQMIAKDGYAIFFTLDNVKKDYARFSEKGATTPLENDLPMLIAFGANGLPLVGPTALQPVTTRFDESMGYDESVDNIGGPMRLVVGMNRSTEFNAPNCAKWLAAIVVGDAGEYRYERATQEVELPKITMEGDWTHGDMYPDFTIAITGTEAKEATLSLKDLEALQSGVIRDYYAASAGRSVYEGIDLKALVSAYLKDGLSRPSAITLIAGDGYEKSLPISWVYDGIKSMYQPGQTRPVLLAYAIDGAPLVMDEQDAAYNGANAFGPVRLVVENTISAWVKNVVTIVIGERE